MAGPFTKAGFRKLHKQILTKMTTKEISSVYIKMVQSF